MSRPKEHYAILRDGYPLGISANNRFLRTYKTRESAERSARDKASDDARYGRGEHTYEVARILFAIKSEGADAE
ncbi:hypothetical protein [Paenibacillus odorifer]|uniref:hypothetical protein n=1 Tax=Paenibacillus TaxID=44249 RepID=UPI00096EE567|nr:hypothetical protein [Paenibacillus odorifer]OMD02524.1 hypothetical protein BJP46_15590 [Paenibacillus odorifer]